MVDKAVKKLLNIAYIKAVLIFQEDKCNLVWTPSTAVRWLASEPLTIIVGNTQTVDQVLKQSHFKETKTCHWETACFYEQTMKCL